MNFLNETGDSKFVAKKWNIVNEQSSANCNVGNEIIYITEVLNSNLCNSNDAYIIVRGSITIIDCDLVMEVTLKNWLPFVKCITNIDGTTIIHAKGLDLLMLMYNILEYSSNYFD